MLDRVSNDDVEVRCDSCGILIDTVKEEDTVEMGCGYAQCSICWELYG